MVSVLMRTASTWFSSNQLPQPVKSPHDGIALNSDPLLIGIVVHEADYVVCAPHVGDSPHGKTASGPCTGTTTSLSPSLR